VGPVGVRSEGVIQAPEQEAVLGRFVLQVLLEREEAPEKKLNIYLSNQSCDSTLFSCQFRFRTSIMKIKADPDPDKDCGCCSRGFILSEVFRI
jgi:hypothetical protein